MKTLAKQPSVIQERSEEESHDKKKILTSKMDDFIELIENDNKKEIIINKIPLIMIKIEI